MQEAISVNNHARPEKQRYQNRVLRFDQISETFEEQGAYHRYKLHHQKDRQQERRVWSLEEFLFKKHTRSEDHCLNAVVVDQVHDQVLERMRQSPQFAKS